MTTKIYDKESVYDEQISPLMTQIIAICQEHQIPMVADFQYANDEENGAAYCTTTLPFEGVASEKMHRVASMMQPKRPVMLAETHVTNADGTKTISIRSV